MSPTRKRRPTLQDIADLTGVTKMTVSRYLRDPQTVAEGTRERIAAAVEELGYIPNRAPDILSNATSRAIGILIPSLSNQVFSAVIHGIEAVTRPAGYQTLLAHYGYSPEREEEQIASLLSYNVDGLILSDSRHTERTRKMIATAGIPVVETMDLPPTPSTWWSAWITRRPPGPWYQRCCAGADVRWSISAPVSTCGPSCGWRATIRRCRTSASPASTC